MCGINGRINISPGKIVEQEMVSGIYIIQKVNCHQCKANVGWTYLKAKNKGQLYKQGKFVMELARVVLAV